MPENKVTNVGNGGKFELDQLRLDLCEECFNCSLSANEKFSSSR